MSQKLAFDKEKRNELLRKGGLLVFVNQAEYLIRVRFGDCQPEPLDWQLEKYILNSGAFGSRSNKVKLDRTKAGTNPKCFYSVLPSARSDDPALPHSDKKPGSDAYFQGQMLGR